MTQPSSLEALLADMSWYGNPRLSKFDIGWHACIDVFLTGDGVEFKVKSEFNCPTPIAATTECHQRLMSALKDLGVANIGKPPG